MEALETPEQELEHRRQVPEPTNPEAFPLLRLPHEIVSLICAQFCYHCQGLELPFRGPRAEDEQACRRALAALSATSKTLQRFAQPVLFHRLWRPKPFRLDILRTLSSRPDLAASVRVLDQSICGEVDRGECSEPEFLIRAKSCTDDPNFVMAMARRLGFDEEFFEWGYDREYDGDNNAFHYTHFEVDDDGFNFADFEGDERYRPQDFRYDLMDAEQRAQADLRDWQESVPESSVGALLPEILIGLLPNLRSLVYAQSCHDDYLRDDRLGRFLHLRKQSLFERLRSLRITNARCSVNFFDSPTKVMIFSAPYLDTLVISHYEMPLPDPPEYREWAPEMPNLRVLQFRHGKLDDIRIRTGNIGLLRVLIKASPKLEQFSFTSNGRLQPTDAQYHPTAELLRCLAPASKTLKHLEIDLSLVDLMVGLYREYHYESDERGSLEGFSALESVQMSAGACSCGRLSYLDRIPPPWKVRRHPDDHEDDDCGRLLDLIGPVSQTLKHLTIRANPESFAWEDVKGLLQQMKRDRKKFSKLRRVELCPTFLSFCLEPRLFTEEEKGPEGALEDLQRYKDEFVEVPEHVDFVIVPNSLKARGYMHT